ncbi:hypothetical protein JCM17380_33590 [Desulfosporosinus burensis]
MGFGPCGVLGAKLAAPDKICVCICGDGGFMMTPHILCTAVEYDIPVVWIVWNNFAYSAIRDIQVFSLGGRELGTSFKIDKTGEPYNPDFVALANACGVEGILVERPEDIRGGLNPAAVTAAARLGAKIVWMPTFSSRQDHINTGQPGGVEITDYQGQLHNSVKEILQIMSQYDLTLATGHISRDEIFVLVTEAKRVGIQRIIATHVSTVQFGPNLCVTDQIALAKMGVYLEHTFVCTLPTYDRISLI